MMTTNNTDLLHQPIPRLLRQLAVPVGVGFFFNTMFNVVDTFYAGRISTSAIASLALCFPLFFVIIAVGVGILMATTSLIGHGLGAGRLEDAKRYAAQAFSFALVHALLVTVAGIVATPWIFTRMGASGEYLALAVGCMRALFSGSVFFLGNYVCNAILSATGDTRSFRNFLVAGFLLNLLLDPWFMYGGFGLPPLGLPGIAWATVAIQGMGGFYLLRRVIGTGLLTPFSAWHFIPRKDSFIRLFSQGVPASLNMLTVSLGIFVITWFIGRYGTSAVAAYGICTRVEQIVLLPVMGLNIATLTLVAQNYGAGQFARVSETPGTALRGGLLLMAFGSVAVFLGGGVLLKLFTRDPEVIAAGIGYFRVNAFVLGAYVILYINNAALQGLQKPAFALWIGLFRQLAAPLVAFPLLAGYLGWGLSGVWWGILLVTWIAAAMSVIYTRHMLRVMARDAADKLLLEAAQPAEARSDSGS
ncbi:MAG: MATE family efflux transporter [Geobacter sp.]|nr:MATE family efflux transporter [Geobacter sp.]